MLQFRRRFDKMKIRGLTIWLFIFNAVLAARSGETAKEARVVCYYTNWSVYRPGTAKFNPQNINPYLCTHLIYAFGGFTKENTLKPFDKYQDIEKGGYAKFTGLKTYNPNLKTMIAIGGWNEGSSRFSSLVASSERRREFVKNTVKFLRQNKFDGLDLDWEYPSFRDGGKPEDRKNYARLVQELREEYEKESQASGRPRLLLTMAVPAGIEYIDKGYDIPKLNRYLDWMNLLTYDYHSAFEPSVNHHAPLYSLEAASEYNFDSELNIENTINHYLQAGADSDKLVLGIPTYGRSYTLINPDANAIGSPADGPGAQGEATREKGYLAYYEICEGLLAKTRSKRDSDDDDDDDEEYEDEEEEWVVVQPNPRALGPYAYKGDQWVGYDDIDIVRKKAEYVAEKSLGGIMFWSIDNDDFRGKCHGKPYPLIEAAKEALFKSLGVSEPAITKKPQGTRKRTRPSKPSKATEDKETEKNYIKTSKTSNRVDSESKITSKANRRRPNTSRRSTTTESTPTSNTPSWGLNTPEPPTTPDPGSDFKCTEEGFFPHPRDCKKYFWCLESGPSNLGIVAHQFTCPSGLHFNKAADSCDFARNVLCNKKKTVVTSAPPASTTKAEAVATEKSTSATTSRPLSSLSALFTTRRPRITAATSSTTLLFKSTTPTSIEEEYDEDEEALEEDLENGRDSEEDPRVIKELVDLIKKLGGVEQLEKHLANSAHNSQATTPPTIKKLFYERVLSQPRAQNERAPPQQNSRGPQTLGLSAEKEDKVVNSRRERPQYTTINRQRPAKTEKSSSEEELTEKDVSEEVETKIISTSSRPGLPQYVNIRRARPSTTEEPQSTERYALFERENESEEEEEEEEEDDDENKNQVQNNEYSTINRFRTSTTESSNSKYKTIQRVRSTTSSTTADDNGKITTLQDSVANSPTEASVPSSSVSTSSQASSIVESTTINEKDSDVTEVNDVNEAVSPSFASENGVILNAGSSSVLNAQITTLSNTPKAAEESSVTPSSIPIAYSTKVTISEEPITSTQRSSPLFAKRTRPTTTVKPREVSEQTTDNKVSFDRKYANIKRTRVYASSSTSSPLLRAPLRNQIADDSEKVIDSDNLGETSETVTKGKLRTNVRKIRSTTPASQENQDPIAPSGAETDYGSKRFVRPQLRFAGRKLNSKSSSEEEDPIEQPPSSNRPALVPRQPPIFPRTKNFFTTTSATIDNEGSGNEFVQTEVATTRTLPNRRFRPSIKDFRGDLSSLTGNDRYRPQSENANNVRVSNVNRNIQRRFRPAFTSTTEQSYDDLDEENNPTESRVVNRPRIFGNRGGNRFSITEDSDAELNTEASEASVYSQRNLNIQRFTPRPFSATTLNREINLKDIYNTKTENENELIVEPPYDSQLIGKARLSAPVINVSEEDKAGRSLFKLPPAPSTSSSQQSINVTKIINSNILLGQTNNKSGILILRRPSRPVSTSAEKNTSGEKVLKAEEISESIQLSETAIEEKEHDEEANVLVSKRPRKRIIVKKIRSTTVAVDVTKDEAVTESGNIDRENGFASNQTGRQRVRKVLRRRPVSTTTITEPSTTERYEPEVEDEISENVVETSTPTVEIQSSSAAPRVRKILRKVLKPVKTDDGKTRILQTGENETVNEVIIKTRIDEVEAVEVSTISSTTLIDNITPEVSVDDISAALESDEDDVLSEQTTASPSSTRPKPDRPSYRPIKRPIGLLTSTEPSTTISKIYSRKFNNAPYTTPLTPDQVTAAEKVRVTPRRPTFSARPINRRPVSTARTTTTDEDDLIDEDLVAGEEPEDLVFVPLDQLFTRGPTIEQTGRKVEDNVEEVNEEDEDEEREEEVTSSSTTPSTTTTRFANRFNSPQRTTSVAPRVPIARQPNRPVGFNRPVGTRPSTEEQVRRFNRPTQQKNRFGTSTASPQESTTRSFSRKFTSIRTPTETLSTTEAIREAIKAKHTQLFSNPKKFSLTTANPLKENTDEDSTDITTDLIETTTDMFDMTESDADIDALFTTTEDFTASMEDETNTENVDDNEITTIYNAETAKPTTERQVFSLSHFNQKNHTVSKNNDDSLPPIINILTTSSTTEPTVEKAISEPIIKTSTQLDKLFEVSRIVEVSSSQEKHRLNRKNESRLIEKTERKLESKPKLDKIGEVSRFTLIKIVEGDIPIYLTNLSHEYPVPNPPNNPIRIDEARNARNLINFSDSGKENLIASESVNSAYNHRNAYIDIIDGPLISDYDRREYSVQSKTEIVKEDKEDEVKEEDTTEEMPATVSESRFVPGAVDLSELTSTTAKSVTLKVAESSTLSLEGLFKADDNSTLTARKVTSEKKTVGGNEPFVVYASPGTTSSPSENNESEKTGRSLDTFAKIQVIRPDEKFEKQEFFGVPAAAESIIEKDKVVEIPPVTVSTIESNKTEETSKAPDAEITIATLDKVVLKKVEKVESVNTTPIYVTESTVESVSKTVSSTTAVVEENQTTTTKAPETESSIVNIQPVVSANDTLSKIAKKRPKLTFPRRNQLNQLKSNNVTRLSILPSSKNKINATTVDVKNVPFTTPKYNRTNSYTSGRSRFSAIRSQNVPIDARKSKAPEPIKPKVISTTEAITKVSTLDNPKKVTIKPLRPGLLRSSAFRRTTTLPPTTQVSEE